MVVHVYFDCCYADFIHGYKEVNFCYCEILEIIIIYAVVISTIIIFVVINSAIHILFASYPNCVATNSTLES